MEHSELSQLQRAWEWHKNKEDCGCVAKLKYRTFDVSQFEVLLETLKKIEPIYENMDPMIVRYVWMIPMQMLNLMADINEFVGANEERAHDVLAQIRREVFRILGTPYALS